jgi:hypothetical protein
VSDSPLLARQDHILCTVCYGREPVHAGHGTPIDTLILAYEMAKKRHPRKKHTDPFKREKRS